MTVPRIIEFCVALLVAFLLITLISFLTLRPALKELCVDAGSEWESFLSEVRERNKLLPGLIEAFKGVESGHGKLAATVLEHRAISTRVTDPERIITSVNAIEASLVQLERIANARPEVARYPPFAACWKEVYDITNRINLLRRSYNKTTRVYNRLLNPFPQNLLTAIFGFVPLEEYPPVGTVGDFSQEK
jgi:LemA protein